MRIRDNVGLTYRVVAVAIENLPSMAKTAWEAIYEAATAKPATILDARGIPTNTCPNCGGNIFKVDAIFDDGYEINFYMFDAECSQCGTLVTAPCPENLVREEL